MGFNIIGKPLAVALMFVYVLPFHVDGYDVHDVNALKKKLMNGYNKHTNPNEGKGPLPVWTFVTILAIGDLDESLEKLTTMLEFGILWNDESLAWNVSEASGIKQFTTDRNEVWVPEFFVNNHHYHANHVKDETRKQPVELIAKGQAAYVQKITAETICDLDMSAFPFDKHTCKLEFVCNTPVRVTAIFRDRVIALLEPDGSWDVVNATMESNGISVIISIRLVRKPTFVLINLIVPMTMLAVLSPLVFLLPNHSGERVGFSITILLAISVFMTIVADNVPNKSHPFPLILTMFFISYSLTVVVVIIVVINARVYRLPDTAPIPRPLIVLYKISMFLCRCFRRRNARRKATVEAGDIDETLALEEEGASGKVLQEETVLAWKDISWGIDMFSMTLLFAMKLILVVVFLVVLKTK